MVLTVVLLTRAGDDDGRSEAPGADEPARRAAIVTRERPPARPAFSWSYDRLIDAIDGRAMRVEGETFRVDRALVGCNGEGAAVRSGGGAPRWGRFTCTQARSRDQLQQDVTFEVRVAGGRRIELGRARWGGR